MPVGGDVTGFSIGLMGFLRKALVSGNWPLWNDLWGYGFPGLAESQMGVYYPPHWFLYGLLPTEVAYTASLVFHTQFAALGAYWAGRRLGVSEWGAALGSWSFVAGGFFVVHLPHQWAYTVGSWTPWAVGLAWKLVRFQNRRRTGLILAAVLAIQVLPGHFQLAFETQIAVLGLAVWTIFARPNGTANSLRSAFTLILTVLATLPLSALQIVPTAQLALQSSSRRGFEYLSGFAASPIHLVSYIAPGLFHRSPLWRPVAWDPFHTSPEEQLAFIGLTPLFLASLAIFRGWKSNPVNRALAWLAMGSLWLSLGPFAPGFVILSKLPGFSFFRGPSRWNLITSIALGLLAGAGFDRIRTLDGVNRSLIRFVMVASAYPILLIIGLEVALFATEGRGSPEITGVFEGFARISPWKNDPSFRDVLKQARRPQNDFRVRTGLAREGRHSVPRSGLSLAEERGTIYVRELAATAGLLLGLLILAIVLRRRNSLAVAMGVLAGLELLYWTRLRTIDLGPIRSLESQSEVLRILASGRRGLRSADPLNNLPMIAEVAPIGAYRTLDLPVVSGLTALAKGPLDEPGFARMVPRAIRAAGVSTRILSAGELAAAPAGVERIEDRALSGWLHGKEWVSGEGASASNFGLWRLPEGGIKAWLLDENRAATALGSIEANRNDAAVVLDVIQAAKPIETKAGRRPEEFEVNFRSERRGLLVLSMLHDPEWSARIEKAGVSRLVEPRRVFGKPGAGAWIGVEVPDAGDWKVVLEYRGRAARLGLGISAVAWLCWVLAYWKLGRNRDDADGDRRSIGIRGAGAFSDPPTPPVGPDRHGDLPTG